MSSRSASSVGRCAGTTAATAAGGRGSGSSSSARGSGERAGFTSAGGGLLLFFAAGGDFRSAVSPPITRVRLGERAPEVRGGGEGGCTFGGTGALNAESDATGATAGATADGADATRGAGAAPGFGGGCLSVAGAPSGGANRRASTLGGTEGRGFDFTVVPRTVSAPGSESFAQAARASPRDAAVAPAGASGAAACVAASSVADGSPSSEAPKILENSPMLESGRIPRSRSPLIRERRSTPPIARTSWLTHSHYPPRGSGRGDVLRAVRVDAVGSRYVESGREPARLAGYPWPDGPVSSR
jgi:hypothetical protein